MNSGIYRIMLPHDNVADMYRIYARFHRLSAMLRFLTRICKYGRIM